MSPIHTTVRICHPSKLFLTSGNILSIFETRMLSMALCSTFWPRYNARQAVGIVPPALPRHPPTRAHAFVVFRMYRFRAWSRRC